MSSTQPTRLKSVGLTGGICSGKSTVVSYIGELIKEYEQLHVQSPSEYNKINFHVIPTDELGWRAYSVGTECYKQVVEVFTPLVKQIVGEEASLLDEQQQINRRVLGRVVFGNSELMKKLTDIVWPEVKQLIEKEISKAEQEAINEKVVCLIESAVLVDANWQKGIDQVWVIDVSNVEERIQRLCQRNQLTIEEAKQRINSQALTSVVLEKLSHYNQDHPHKPIEVTYLDTHSLTLEQVKQKTRELFYSQIVESW